LHNRIGIARQVSSCTSRFFWAARANKQKFGRGRPQSVAVPFFRQELMQRRKLVGRLGIVKLAAAFTDHVSPFIAFPTVKRATRIKGTSAINYKLSSIEPSVKSE